MMLLGMALFKLGVFSASKSRGVYMLMVIIGFGIGIPLILTGLSQHEAHDYAQEYSQFVGMQYNYWGSLGVALGWVGIVMLVCKAGLLNFIAAALAAVGRMALTNYLMHSIVCTLFFYGYGLGYYGSFNLAEQMIVVGAVWLFQLIASPIWLTMFRFGPAEWLWRSMTYWRRQPMLIQR